MADVAEKRVEQHEHEYSEEDYEHAKSVEMPVMIAKIDCVDHKDLCQREGIRAYPSLLLFINGERWHEGGYRGSRTVVAMADWLRQVEDAHKEEDENAPRTIGDAHTGTNFDTESILCVLLLQPVTLLKTALFVFSCQGSNGTCRRRAGRRRRVGRENQTPQKPTSSLLEGVRTPWMRDIWAPAGGPCSRKFSNMKKSKILFLCVPS